MRYLSFSISIAFISWIVGMIIMEIVKKTALYNKLSNLNFIKDEKLNKIIGIGLFKWIVKNTFFKYLNQKLKLKNKIEPNHLIELRKEMTYSEISHLIGFVFVMFFALYKSISTSYWFGITIMIVNVLLNLYPSLLQQQNKRRIDQFIKRMKV